MLCLMLLVVFAVFWGGDAFGQRVDFSGSWYIANNDNYFLGNAGNYYLVPARNPQQSHNADAYFNNQYCEISGSGDYTDDHYGDEEKPFLTTHKNGYDAEPENLIWRIVSTGDGYYNIIHDLTGKYVVYEPPYQEAIHRKSMHLEDTNSPGNNAKFVITGTLTGNINFRPMSVSSGNCYWNPSGGNSNQYYGTGTYLHVGMVGLYSDAGSFSVWRIENMPPVITYDYATGLVTITGTGSVYYTVDGSNPTTSSTLYTEPFLQNEPAYINAIAVMNGVSSSAVTLNLQRVATPVIAVNTRNAIEITCATRDASIYYTTDGSTPTTESTPYVGPLTDNVSGKTIKAIAVKDNMMVSFVQKATLKLKCDKPLITCNGNNFTIAPGSFPSGVTVTVYYTYGDNPANPATTSSSTTTSVSISIPHTPYTVKAYAVAEDYYDSDVRTVTLGGALNGLGTEANPYLIASNGDFIRFTLLANTSEGSNKWYKLTANVSASGSSTISQTFSGVLEGSANENGVFYTISDLEQPIFNLIDGGFLNNTSFAQSQAVVRNVFLREVNISGHTGNTGAIACTAKGNVCIYNCGILSGSVGGTGDTGGLVGVLDYYAYANNSQKYSFARVVNCFSFADITSAGTYAAGIVGNNKNASTTANHPNVNSNLRTAVVNCMFYGDVYSGTNKAPVYGNKRLVNSNNNGTGINNYNYFMVSATLDDDYTSTDQYNCSWPVEERFLTRFEYFRNIFNSNRTLITWYVTGKKLDTQTDADRSLIAKWVLDPSIAKYPILKRWGKYPTNINVDKNQVWNEESQTWISRESAKPYQGKKLGELSVTVKSGKHPKLSTYGLNSSQYGDKEKTLYILDMDTLNNDFGYYKVQLPYYNELFGNQNGANHYEKYCANYTDSIVTGWKITSVTGGELGVFIGDVDKTMEGYLYDGTYDTMHAWESGFNFADRNCTAKDQYAISGRVFAQGGYYYVPEGVSAITIEAYWGKAVYVCNTDYYVDRVNLSDKPFTLAGTFPNKFPANVGDTVYTSINNAINSSGLDYEGSGASAKTVYDQAIVLVGNLQHRNSDNKFNYGWHTTNGDESFGTQNIPFTLTTVDLDFDMEPDYCFEWQFSKGTTRLNLHPIRFDFLPVPTLGMAIRTGGALQTIGVFAPRGHFEITETSSMHTAQFEYDSRDDYRKKEAPLILNGGEFEQFVSSNNWKKSYGPLNRTKYIILGGHVWLKEFSPGKHGDLDAATRHCAVSVLGGDYDRFCLSGLFLQNNHVLNSPDNPHCYINGGRFGTMSGAGMENIAGNVIFEIDHSLIGEFYGGGLNATRPITGDIVVTINNSIVGKYCGGPYTGDMTVGKIVTTEANNTIFGLFFGGGNGGTNYNRDRQYNSTQGFANITQARWKIDGKFDEFTPLTYVSLNAGYQAQFEFELIDMSSGSDNNAVMRTYYQEAQFTATEVGEVTSNLTDCTVLKDFYGGGNLGKVKSKVTSKLTNTTVMGSVFGAGNSGEIPTFPIHDKETVVFPWRDYGSINHPGSLDYVRDNGNIRYYKWIHDLPAGVTANTGRPFFFYENEWYCFTEKDMNNLGAVEGDAILTLQGTTTVFKNVYGGGNESTVGTSTKVGNTLVKVLERTRVLGNIYGGGNMGKVFGDTKVIINGTWPEGSGTGTTGNPQEQGQ